MKKLTIIINIVVIICTFAFSRLVNYEFTNPAALMATDKSTYFDLSDIYATVGNGSASHNQSEDIVIVNTDHCTRSQIAEAIETVNGMNPKVIGLDLMFIDSMDYHDRLLSSILGCNALVLPISLEGKEKGNDLFEIKDSSYFYNLIPSKKLGVINLAGNGPASVIRTFSPFFKLKDYSLDNFSSAIVKCYSNDKYEELKKKQGRLFIHYHAIDFEIERWNEIKKEDIEGKIVLIGSINNESDQHLTPIGVKSGIIIHAATINTILYDNYIEDCSTILNYIIAFFSTLCFVSLMSYAKLHLSNMGNLLPHP